MILKPIKPLLLLLVLVLVLVFDVAFEFSWEFSIVSITIHRPNEQYVTAGRTFLQVSRLPLCLC